ncbi:MAG: glycosyltransferase family 4 protein [Spirulinaceae cyanobacterium]
MNKKAISTLFITRHLPYPPMGGVALRNWQNINIMKTLGSVAVVSIVSEKVKGEGKFPEGVEIWHNYYFEELAKRRSLFRKVKDKLWWLQPAHHPWSNQLYGEVVVKQIKEILAEFKPSIVILEELWLHRYLSLFKRHDCKVIYDAHNIETFLRQDMQTSLDKKVSQSWLKHIETIEQNLFEQTDQVWVCSEEDASLLQKLATKEVDTHVVSNGVNPEYYDPVRLGQCHIPPELSPNSQTLIFTASYTHEPNLVAMRMLVEKIYPRLQEIYPHCRLLLVGRNPTAYMKQIAKKEEGIIVTGKVEDIRPYLAAARVMVVPLLEGGGTRLKILEAFAAGCPVVTTSKGAEGIKAEDGTHLLIRDSVDEIVAAVSQLWANSYLGRNLAKEGYDLLQAEYSWQAVSEKVRFAVDKIRAVP